MPTSIFKKKSDNSENTTGNLEDASIPAAECQIHGLMELGQFSIVKDILEKMPAEKRAKEINSPNACGETLVIVAAQQNNVAAFRWLINNGADPLISDPAGCTAEGWAKAENYSGILKVLAEVSCESPASVTDSPCSN